MITLGAQHDRPPFPNDQYYTKRSVKPTGTTDSWQVDDPQMTQIG